MRLRSGGVTDTPTEQPIPERWGGASITLPTLQAPIGQTASITMLVGCLCLTEYTQAAGPSLHLSAEVLDFAQPLELPGPPWAARQDSGEPDGTACCTALVNPWPDGFKFQGGRGVPKSSQL